MFSKILAVVALDPPSPKTNVSGKKISWIPIFRSKKRAEIFEKNVANFVDVFFGTRIFIDFGGGGAEENRSPWRFRVKN